MNDLISRQAVIEINQSYHGQMPNEVNHRIWKEINELPSAQPTEASCWGCNCQKMERLKEQKTFSEMVHLHDAETHEERTGTHACDYINRKDAIEAHYEYCNKHPDAGFPVWSLKILENLPSAQPEKRTDKCTEMHACDLIDRQTAIDAILAVTGNSSVRELYEHVQEHGLSDMWSGGVNAAIDVIIAVPSAQPEIIHCKECKFLQKWRSEESAKKFGQIYECLRDVLMSPLPDDFCSKGKRRTDG